MFFRSFRPVPAPLGTTAYFYARICGFFHAFYGQTQLPHRDSFARFLSLFSAFCRARSYAVTRVCGTPHTANHVLFRASNFVVCTRGQLKQATCKQKNQAPAINGKRPFFVIRCVPPQLRARAGLQSVRYRAPSSFRPRKLRCSNIPSRRPQAAAQSPLLRGYNSQRNPRACR